MKIDIRKMNSEPAVHAITFADSDSMKDSDVVLQSGSINIDCRLDTTTTANVKDADIPNLIKALQKVCEIKGIKR